MAQKAFRFNTSQSEGSIDVPWNASAILVDNPTASPVFIRLGAPDIPSEVNADIIVPAGVSRSYPFSGSALNQFGVKIDNPSLVANANSGISGLYSTVIVTVQTADEKMPTYGSLNFLSLSLSDLTQGTVAFAAGGTTSSAFNLTPWGGAVVSVLAAPLTGQGVITIQASQNGSTNWQNVLTVTFWRDTPLTINVARTLRFFRVVINATAIPGEANIGGTYSVRASLTEIIQTTWSAGAGEINYGFSIPSLGTQSIYFCTVGLRAVNVRISFSSGTQGEVVFYTSSSATANWALASYREQNIAGFYNSIYRSIGNVDNFLRIDLLEIANTGPMNGNIRLSIQAEPDLSNILQLIYAALGDQGQPTNVGQSIYHKLAQMYTSIGTGNLTTIMSSINTLLSSFQTDRRAYTEFFFYPLTVVTSGVMVSTPGILGPYANRYIVSTQLNYRRSGKYYSPGSVYYGPGGAGGINQYWYRGYEDISKPQFNMPPLPFNAGSMGGGLLVNPGWDRLWLYADSPMSVDLIMGVR